MTKKSYKGLALSSQSIKVFEDCLHKEKDELKSEFGCTSSNQSKNSRSKSEVNSEILSSKCYWEDIEPKLNEKGVILDFSVPLQRDKFNF